MGDRSRRPSVNINLDSFESDALENATGFNPIDSSKMAFEEESTESPGQKAPGQTSALAFSPFQNVPGLGRRKKNGQKGSTSLATYAESPMKSKDDYQTNASNWAKEAEDSMYASGNKIDEEEMEDKLDQEARASGFDFTPENPMQALFILLDEPSSGFIAGLVGKTVMILIIISSLCLIIETHPPMGPCADPAKAAMWGYKDPAACCADWDTTLEEATKTVDTFHLIEAVVILVFSAEYGLRVLLCKWRPRRNRSFFAYIIRPLNVVDLISVLPWWFERAYGGNSGLAVVRMARLARVFRLLKAGTFLQELQLFVWGYYRAREGLLLLFFLLFMYLACFGAVLYLLEYNPQSDACFAEAGYPECWGRDDDLGKDVVRWETIIEFGDGCHHCDGNRWNCTLEPADGLSTVRMVDRLGDCVGANETVGEVFVCDPTQPHYTDSDCRSCSEVEWPGKEPMRCAIRPFTSIPVTTYFIMATMTTVGYGEHYPNSPEGKVACGVCMMAGIMVLALPMVIIGQAFEETIREEKKMALERERRLKIILLSRNQKAVLEDQDTSQQELEERDKLAQRLTDDILELDKEKAEREKYDIDTCRFILINVMANLGELTHDDRFTGAMEILQKEADAV